MFRLRKCTSLIMRKNSLITRLKNKLLNEDDEEKSIIPHHQIRQPLNVKQEIEQFVSIQNEISDLERLRMKRLDDKLGTNTHFHEIQSYEERLDSDNVMRRQILAKRDLMREKDLAIAHLFNPDPQIKIKTPWIRDIAKFTKEAIQQIPYPKHDKYFQEGDFFKYFEPKFQDIEKIAKFDFSESLYTQLVQLQMLKREESIKFRYQELIDNFQNIPIVYKDYIYFSKDSKEGHPKKMKVIELNINESSNFKNELIFDNDELILSGNIIQNLIPKQYEDLILDIQEEQITSLYKSFLPNEKHDTFGCIIEYGELSFLIVKSKTIQLILENVGNSFAFRKNYLYYIENTDLKQPKYVLKINLNDFNDRKIVYQIQPGETVKFQAITENDSIIEVIQGNSNRFLNIKGQEFMLFDSEYVYKADKNKENFFYIKNLINKNNANTLFTKEGQIIYENKQGYIQEFISTDYFIAILEKSNDQNLNNLLIIKEKNNHQLQISESQYSIVLEQNQIKDSNLLYFQLICPYKPFQIMKYNVDIKSISIHFQESFPGFDYQRLQIDKVNINDQLKIFISYISDIPFNFILINLIDSTTYQSLNQEDVIIYENGGAICQILVNPENQQQILDDFPQILQQLQIINSKVILSTNGALSGLIGSYTHFFKQQFYALLCHNGLFDNSKSMIDLQISSYDISKIPSLRNTYISYTYEDQLAYQSQKLIALLRENKYNQVDIKKEYGVILQQCQNETDEILFRLTFLLSII